MLNLVKFCAFFFVLRISYDAIDQLCFELLFLTLEALLVVAKFSRKPVNNQLEVSYFFFLLFLDKLSASEAAGLCLGCLAS